VDHLDARDEADGAIAGEGHEQVAIGIAKEASRRLALRRGVEQLAGSEDELEITRLEAPYLELRHVAS
jgi:hypothetical protein